MIFCRLNLFSIYVGIPETRVVSIYSYNVHILRNLLLRLLQLTALCCLISRTFCCMMDSGQHILVLILMGTASSLQVSGSQLYYVFFMNDACNRKRGYNLPSIFHNARQMTAVECLRSSATNPESGFLRIRRVRV